MRICLLAIFAIVSTVYSYAQEFASPISSFNLNASSLDPQLLNSENSLHAGTFYKQQSNLFKDVNVFYFTGTYCKPKSRFTASIVSDQKGPYIDKNRIYFQYTVHVKTQTNTFLSASIGGGLLHYAVGGDDVGGRFSDIAPDLQIGVSFYNSILRLSSYYGQFMNQKIRPYNEELVLNSKFQLFSDYLAYEQNVVKLYALLQYTSIAAYSNEIYLGSMLNYRTNYSGSISLSNYGKALFQISTGISYIKLNVNINFGYELQTALLNQRGTVSTYQVGIILKK